MFQEEEAPVPQCVPEPNARHGMLRVIQPSNSTGNVALSDLLHHDGQVAAFAAEHGALFDDVVVHVPSLQKESTGAPRVSPDGFPGTSNPLGYYPLRGKGGIGIHSLLRTHPAIASRRGI